MAEKLRSTKQQEREQRILDAAGDLIRRWGYDKTAMDDISDKSGVAKGTIYLHWKTREELFEALLRRESQALMNDFKQSILQDPAGATLRGIYRQAALALRNVGPRSTSLAESSNWRSPVRRPGSPLRA